jgi:hypothetical protein
MNANLDGWLARTDGCCFDENGVNERQPDKRQMTPG